MKRTTTTSEQQQQETLSYKDFSMWDRDLALLLWREYARVVQEKQSVVGTSSSSSSSSPLTGYIEYLCQQDNFSLNQNNPYAELYDDTFQSIPFEDIDVDTYVPPSTAPHTIRQWTQSQQLAILSQTTKGQQLLQIAKEQMRIWRMKYDSLQVDPKCTPNQRAMSMSFPQFVWAMEVVHSRAFCGLPIIVQNDQNSNNVESSSSSSTSSSSSLTRNFINLLRPILPDILVPVLAATIGYTYAISE
jgi:hypothetical protein